MDFVKNEILKNANLVKIEISDIEFLDKMWTFAQCGLCKARTKSNLDSVEATSKLLTFISLCVIKANF